MSWFTINIKIIYIVIFFFFLSKSWYIHSKSCNSWYLVGKRKVWSSGINDEASLRCNKVIDQHYGSFLYHPNSSTFFGDSFEDAHQLVIICGSTWMCLLQFQYWKWMTSIHLMSLRKANMVPCRFVTNYRAWVGQGREFHYSNLFSFAVF